MARDEWRISEEYGQIGRKVAMTKWKSISRPVLYLHNLLWHYLFRYFTFKKKKAVFEEIEFLISGAVECVENVISCADAFPNIVTFHISQLIVLYPRKDNQKSSFQQIADAHCGHENISPRTFFRVYKLLQSLKALSGLCVKYSYN